MTDGNFFSDEDFEELLNKDATDGYSEKELLLMGAESVYDICGIFADDFNKCFGSYISLWKDRDSLNDEDFEDTFGLFNRIETSGRILTSPTYDGFVGLVSKSLSIMKRMRIKGNPSQTYDWSLLNSTNHDLLNLGKGEMINKLNKFLENIGAHKLLSVFGPYEPSMVLLELDFIHPY